LRRASDRSVSIDPRAVSHGVKIKKQRKWRTFDGLIWRQKSKVLLESMGIGGESEVKPTIRDRGAEFR
jgi:hypothetical protein